MAVMYQKIKEAVLGENGETIIRHYETDTDCVLMPDGVNTLSTFLVNFLGNRTIIISGDATGSVSYRPVEEGTVELEVEITDDSHKHTGATILMGTKNRVIVSGADNGIVVSPVTATELESLVGINGGVQAQLDQKAPGTHNHDTTYIKQTSVGAAGGTAPLDASGKIPAQYLPGFVDDVIEGVVSADLTSFTPTGWDTAVDGDYVIESGKIYLDVNTDKDYRWTGTKLKRIGDDGVVLGETEQTAYRGDRGAIAYLHSQQPHAPADATVVANSTTNGNILIGGKQTVVYNHPSITVTPETDTESIARGKTFQAITGITVNAQGHVTGKKTTTFTIPNHVDIQTGAAKPTNQVAGDFWFQDIS